jgi:hypothetical protein
MERIAVADAAALMIMCERLGFRVDPSAMVAAVLPTLKGATRVTDSELALVQFARTRHRTFPLTIARKENTSAWTRKEEFRTSTGYRATGYLDDDGVPVLIEVRAPKYRRMPEPVGATCDVCGMAYMRGDPDESAQHRRHHRKVVAVTDPKPDPRVAAAVASGWDGRVDKTSPQWMHTAVYGRAKLFKREFHYDFVHWSPNGEREADVVGFLFTDPMEDGRIVGACCFRLRDRADGSKIWSMDWVWLAPGARRTGLLNARWPGFLREFGAFHVERPLSNAMEAFLARHGDPEKVAVASVSA